MPFYITDGFLNDDYKGYGYITQEMIENTKKFAGYYHDKAWNDLIDEHQSLFNWFYNIDFIHKEQQSDKNHLTESELKYIEDVLYINIWKELTGETKIIDWFSPFKYVLKTKNHIRKNRGKDK